MNKLILKQLTPLVWEGKLYKRYNFDFSFTDVLVGECKGTRLEVVQAAHEEFGCNNFVIEEA